MLSVDTAHSENASKNREANRGGDDCTTVAVGTVVAPDPETDDQSHPAPTQLQVNTDHGGQVPGPAIPPAAGCSSPEFYLRARLG